MTSRAEAPPDDDARSAKPDRSARVGSVFCCWLLNVALGSLIGLAYLESAPPADSVRVWLFMHAAVVSSVATVAMVLALVLAVLAWFVAERRVFVPAQAAVWSLFLVGLFADTRIYSMFRYHFNGLVWNVITTPGAEDAVVLGPKVWLLLGGAAAVLFWIEARVGSFVVARWNAGESARARPLARWTRAGVLCVFATVLFEKAVYAHADLGRERKITALSKLYPLYQRLTVSRLAQRVFGMDLEARARVELGGEGMFLRYPLERPRVDPNGARPNILVIVIDSLRADVLDAKIMPEVSAFAARARRFDDHLSGGNATRFGIFSLVYGIHGAYWKPVRDEHTPPVLVTTLQELGYDISILSAASMNFPEFRSTAWVTVEDRIEDEIEGPKYHRDLIVAERFAARLRDRAAGGSTQPFFTFALLDSPHQRYSVPPGPVLFEPSADDLDYVELSRSSSPPPERVTPVKNRFLNAVHHADRVAGQMLAALEASGELERTLVVITGDHGEEFFEHGFFGHTSNYTPTQVHVAFVMGGPGIPPGVETRPTSHLDLCPTLLELLGVDPSLRAAYSQGESLLAPLSSRNRILSGWDDVAIWVPEGILHVPLEGHRGLIEAYDYAWRPIDEGPLVAKHGAVLAALALDCRRFLR